MTQTVAIGADHAGVALKEVLVQQLAALGWSAKDLGAYGDASVDYPDFGRAVADFVASGQAQFGVVICGSGIGISIAANRNPKIRAALCYQPELVKLARLHNDANVLALGARWIDQAVAIECLNIFLSTPFEGGRHAVRVEKLSQGC